MTDSSMDDFIIEKVLGKGSFGSVYLVRRKEDDNIYALKSVILEKLNKKEQQNSVNEVRILASVNHPNVIGYKEAFWDDKLSSLNIVMEYADDGDLQTKIGKMRKEGGMFQENLIWSYSIQMIEGLKALHDKKIMHRDLKSANIFLVRDKHQCKLGDMNVSKVIKEKELLTQTGTPYYASPEVWRDEPYSYKSDLWSIGCVIYELCSLRPPFKGKDLDELFMNVCKGKPDRISHVYSDDLWKMILMLLQVDVKKRCDCDMFLNSKLITRKIQEMKNESKDYRNLEKNKEISDGSTLLDTIRFDNILDIKRQLPTKKNYNNNVNKSPKKNINKKVIKKKKINLNINTNDSKYKINRNINSKLVENSNSNKYHKINNKNKNKKIFYSNKNLKEKNEILIKEEQEKIEDKELEIQKEKENEIIEDHDSDKIDESNLNSELQQKKDESSLIPSENQNSINNPKNDENDTNNIDNENSKSSSKNLLEKNKYIKNSPNPKLSGQTKGIIYQKPKFIENSVRRIKKDNICMNNRPMTTKRTTKKINFIERNTSPKKLENKLMKKSENDNSINNKGINSLRNKKIINDYASINRGKTQKYLSRPIEKAPSINFNNSNNNSNSKGGIYLNAIKKKNYTKKLAKNISQRPQSATPSKKNEFINSNISNNILNNNITELNVNYENNTNNDVSNKSIEFMKDRENMANKLINTYNKKSINFNSYNPNNRVNGINYTEGPSTTTNTNKKYIRHPIINELGFDIKNPKKIMVKLYNKNMTRDKNNLSNKKRIINDNVMERDMTEPELFRMVNPIKIDESNKDYQKTLNISLNNQGGQNSFLHQKKMNKMIRYNTNNNPRYNQYYANNLNQSNPQIFNNFVSINNLVTPNYPVKVINVFGQ